MIKVLLVEDDPLILRLYLRAFTYEQIEVQVAENGRAGLEKLNSFRPDIVLVDIMMPVMNGLEMLAKLKAEPATQDIPVIMLTNLSDVKTSEDAIKQGAIQCVVKSKYSPVDVVEIIKNVVASNGGGGA